jgi:hypothetical protein
MDTPPQAVTGSVVRYRPARIRLGQILIPCACIASVLARRLGGPVYWSAAVALLLAALGAFLAAWRGFGRRPVRVDGGKIRYGEEEPPIVPSRVTEWTLFGSTARLYGDEFSWKIKTDSSDAESLYATLVRVLGRPLSLQPRGSRRARLVALAVSVGGAAVVLAAIFLDVMPLFPVGVLSALGGFTALGVLSQKIAGPRQLAGFRAWRTANGKGSDLLVYSDVLRTRLSTPDTFEV